MSKDEIKRAKGRILRVKEGYNPNSSSMGSIVFALPVTLLAVTAGFGAVSAVIMSAMVRKDPEEAAKPSDEAGEVKGE